VDTAAAAKQPFKATLNSCPPATKPWEHIHVDFAGPHLGRHFLIVVDAYSKYTEVISALNTTSRHIEKKIFHFCYSDI